MASKLVIEPFSSADQQEVKRLVLAGLGEHWGFVDESVNRDLDEIAASYRDGVFLVAKVDGIVVGAGALIPRSRGVGEIVRMSVAKQLRRTGIARRILRELIARASQFGVKRIVLETTAAWREVVAFYVANGFTITHEAEGAFGAETWLALDLDDGL
jgi:GNAT superfamily N-acetyltransferase